MTENNIEPTEVLAEPPLPTPPAAQPADAEQHADQVVPQESAPVFPQQAAPVVPQEAAPVVQQEAAPVVPQQADQAMPHNPYAQSHVVPQQAEQLEGTSPAQEEKQVITFDLSDGRLPPPKFIPTAQEMYAELWEVGQRLVDEGLAQKGTAHGAAIVGSGADLLARAAEGMQQCEIPNAARNFFDGILASLNSAIAEKADIFSMLNRKPGQGGAAS